MAAQQIATGSGRRFRLPDFCHGLLSTLPCALLSDMEFRQARSSLFGSIRALSGAREPEDARIDDCLLVGNPLQQHAAARSGSASRHPAHAGRLIGMTSQVIVPLLIASVCCAWGAPATPARGSLLVATSASRDSDFAETVVLILHNDERGAVGIVLNRPLTMRLGEVFPEVRQGSGLRQPAWAGGPVPLGINALLRTGKPPQGADAVLPGVFVLATRDLMRAQIAAGTPATRFRVYIGQCGWGAGQLHGELQRGLWRVVPATAAIVFDTAPETLWPRLSAVPVGQTIGFCRLPCRALEQADDINRSSAPRGTCYGVLNRIVERPWIILMS